MVSKGATALVTCIVVVTARAAHAQVNNTGVLDKALERYRVAAEGWQSAGQAAATTLFWSLAAISLAWTMGQLALRRAELGEFFGELVRYILFTGFWAWMLNNGPTHAQLIIESTLKLAGGASGQNMMSPSGVLDVGFHLVDRALTQSTILSPLDSAIGIVLALVILVVLALVGVSMLVTLIACWIVAYGGLIVLGFGGSRWTSDMAINYYRMVLSLGLQVLAMVLLVGIGEGFLRSYYGALDQDVSLHEQAVLLVVAIVLLATVNRVPALLGTLVNGSSPQYALGAGPGAGAALSAISTVGGLAAWSSVAGRAAAEGGAGLAFGAGSLAKAMAAATTGAAGSAVTSLLDGFRSSGTAHAFGTATGTSGGSASDGTATATSASAPMSPTRPSGSQAPDALRRTAGQPATRAAVSGSTFSAEPPAKAAYGAPETAAAESRAKARTSATTGGGRDRRPEPSARASSEQARANVAGSTAAAPSAARLHKENGVGPNARESDRSTSEAASRPSVRSAGASVAASEGANAGTPVAGGIHVAPAPSTSSPAGTFAASSSRGFNAGTTTASSGPTAAPSTPSPSASTAPRQTLASASRDAAPQLDIPFSVRPSDELPTTAQRPGPTAPPDVTAQRS